MKIFDGGYCVPFLVEEDVYEGVKMKMAADIR